MKTTRIRYNEDTIAGVLTSRGTFLTNEEKELSVLINTKNNTYTIVSVESNTPLKEGGAETLNLTKKAAKNALIMLGVSFSSESRNTHSDDDNKDVDGDEDVGFHSAR